MKKLNTINGIITHSGQAHRDDWLAVSLAVFIWGVVPIFRREPEEVELDDEGVLILDVGGQYDPDVLNFDHHQMDTGDSRCAVEMLLEHIDPEWHKSMMADRKEGRSYLKSVALQDSLGWRRAKELGCQEMSLFESDMVALFGGTEAERDLAIQAGVAFWKRRREVFSAQASIDAWVDANPLQYMTVLGHQVPIMPSAPRGMTGWQVIAAYERKHGWTDHSPAVVVFPDDRGPGWGVLRRNDAPGIDFSSLGSDPRVEFAHRGGFIFKTRKRLSLQFLTRLIALGYVDEIGH